jgi:hypothetical protein
MRTKTVRLIAVAITTFIPWLITLAAIGAASMLPRPAFIVVHYTLVVLLFGIAFCLYYKERKGVDPFTVTMIGMLCFIVYEIVYHSFFEGQPQFLTYVDWFVPAFLIASTIYWTGTFFTKE